MGPCVCIPGAGQRNQHLKHGPGDPQPHRGQQPLALPPSGYPTTLPGSLWFPAARPTFLSFPPSFLFCQLEKLEPQSSVPKAEVTWPRANGKATASAYFPIVQNALEAAQTGVNSGGEWNPLLENRRKQRSVPASKKIQVEELKGSQNLGP